jgi:hypothetical protein
MVMGRMSREAARRIADEIARLPDLLARERAARSR